MYLQLQIVVLYTSLIQYSLIHGTQTKLLLTLTTTNPTRIPPLFPTPQAKVYHHLTGVTLLPRPTEEMDLKPVACLVQV